MALGRFDELLVHWPHGFHILVDHALRAAPAFRDIAERGRSTESVINQYMETVRPMYKQFIEPTKRHAHVILPHGANGPAVDIITTKVASLIKGE